MFSEAVDTVLGRMLGGQDTTLRTQVVGYTNMTLHELSSRREFRQDMIESSIAVANSSSQKWDKPARFRRLSTALFMPYRIPPEYVAPGPKLERHISKAYFYTSQDYYIFGNMGLNTTIAVEYLLWPRRFKYYETGKRPAVFNEEAEAWTYLTDASKYVDNLANNGEEETARGLVTNWILQDYSDVVVEGTLAKLLKIRQDPMAATTYSLFKQFEESFISNAFAQSAKRV